MLTISLMSRQASIVEGNKYEWFQAVHRLESIKTDFTVAVVRHLSPMSTGERVFILFVFHGPCVLR